MGQSPTELQDAIDDICQLVTERYPELTFQMKILQGIEHDELRMYVQMLGCMDIGRCGEADFSRDSMVTILGSVIGVDLDTVLDKDDVRLILAKINRLIELLR